MREALDSIREESLSKAAVQDSVCFLNNSVRAAWVWWKNRVQGFPWNFKQRSRCQREVRSEDLPRGKPGLGSKERGHAVSLATQKAARAKSPGRQVWSAAAGICWLLPAQHLKVISTRHTPRRAKRDDGYLLLLCNSLNTRDWKGGGGCQVRTGLCGGQKSPCNCLLRWRIPVGMYLICIHMAQEVPQMRGFSLFYLVERLESSLYRDSSVPCDFTVITVVLIYS